MSRLGELIHYPGRIMHRHSHETAWRPTRSILGIILLAIGAYTIYRLWPEIQRYQRIERM